MSHLKILVSLIGLASVSIGHADTVFPLLTPQRMASWIPQALAEQISSTSMQSVTQYLIQEKHLHPLIRLHRMTLPGGNFASLAGGRMQIASARYFVGDVALCDQELREVTLPQGTQMLLGDVPQVLEVADPRVYSWPTPEEMQGTLKTFVRDKFPEHSSLFLRSKPTTASRCLMPVGGDLRPAHELLLQVDRELLHVIADQHTVYVVKPQSFDAQGLVRAFITNSNDGKVADFKIEVHDNGALASPHFKVFAPDGKTLVSPDHRFQFDPGDERFGQASVFVHATRQLKFFENLGLPTDFKQPIAILVHDPEVNNAAYINDPRGPMITVGDGDGVVLQNLATDSDVLAHELGHHVIFNTLQPRKYVDLDGFALHEGLADFFAMARSGSACLGQSVCPLSSSKCWERARCLRSANNSLRFGEESFASLDVHEKGQIVSGMLWDMLPRVPADDLHRLVYYSLSFLLRHSTYQDFFKALLNADHAFFNGKYAQAIIDAGYGRGFDDTVSGISLTQIDGQIPVQPTEGASGGQSTKKKQSLLGGGCAVVKGSKDSTNASSILLAALLLPLMLLFLNSRYPKKLPCRVRVRRR